MSDESEGLKLDKQPDELIRKLDEISFDTPSSRLGNYLDDYAEAEKIAESLTDGIEEIDEEEVLNKTVKLIREKADLFGVKMEGLEESIKNESFKDDFPSCSDFVNFVLLAIEERHVKMIDNESSVGGKT